MALREDGGGVTESIRVKDLGGGRLELLDIKEMLFQLDSPKINCPLRKPVSIKPREVFMTLSDCNHTLDRLQVQLHPTSSHRFFLKATQVTEFFKATHKFV